MMKNENGSFYGWFIILLGCLTNFLAVGIPLMCMPVLFKQISDELGLSLAQVGAVWGMLGLGNMLNSPFAGMIGDRFGIKPTVIFFCIFSGTLCAARGMANSFAMLSITMFLYSFMANPLPLIIYKSSSAWIPPKKIVIANGILSTGVALGFLSGVIISDTYLSPLVGGWRKVLYIYGALAVVMGVIWSFTRREPVITESDGTANSPGFIHALSHVIRIKNVWLLSLTHLFYAGCMLGAIGYLPLYLRGIGWSMGSANGAVGLFNAAGMICAIPITIISERLGIRKKIIIAALVISTIAMSLLSFQTGIMVLVFLILLGFTRDGYVSVILTMTTESEGVGPKYAATAMGMIFAFGNMGVFLSSPVGNRLAEINTHYALFFWAALIMSALIIFSFTRERARMYD